MAAADPGVEAALVCPTGTTSTRTTGVSGSAPARGQQDRGGAVPEDVGPFERAGVGRHGDDRDTRRRPPSTATTVSRLAVASTATAGRPWTRAATAAAAAASGREVEGPAVDGHRRRPDGRVRRRRPAEERDRAPRPGQTRRRRYGGAMPTFDIVSQVDMQEVRNAVDQAQRELATRFDFKGTESTVELHGHGAAAPLRDRGPAAGRGAGRSRRSWSGARSR